MLTHQRSLGRYPKSDPLRSGQLGAFQPDLTGPKLTSCTHRNLQRHRRLSSAHSTPNWRHTGPRGPAIGASTPRHGYYIRSQRELPTSAQSMSPAFRPRSSGCKASHQFGGLIANYFPFPPRSSATPPSPSASSTASTTKDH